jgi:hypothetical protein
LEVKKTDWLDLDQAVVREITLPSGEKDFYIRNLGDFRGLRREQRFHRAKRKLEALWDDENSVLSHVHKPLDTIGKFDKPIVPSDEALAMLGTSNQLENDILRLLDKLSGSTGDINALWRVI